MKTRIMLICAAGMSTSLLVTKMINTVDCILLGPQVRYAKSEVEKLIEETGKDIPLDVIEMKDYGMMDGKAVYEFAKKLLNK